MQQDSDQGRLRLAATKIVLLLAIGSVGACDSGTDRIIEAPTSADTLVASDGATGSVEKAVPPTIEQITPTRGAWQGPGQTVQVGGLAVAGSGPLSHVIINGTPALLEGSDFSTSLPAQPGVNIVGVRVEAEDGERAVDGRAFFSGPVHPPGAIIPQAARIHLAEVFLDDDEPDLDDVAAFVEATLVDPQVLSAFTKPVDTQYAVLTAHEIDLGEVRAEILPTAGELSLEVAATDVHIEFDLEGKPGLGSLLTGAGSLDAERVDVRLFLALSVVDGQVEAGVTWVEVDMIGFEVTHEALDSFGPDLQAALKAFVKDYVASTFEDLASEKVGDLVVQFLQEFEFATSFGEETVLDISLSLEQVDVTAFGIDLVLGGSVTSALGDAVVLNPNAGTLKTQSTPPDPFLSDAPVAFLIDDDLVNQFLFAYWHAGAISGLELTAADLAESGVDLAGLPKVFQPLKRVSLDTLLPMTMGPRLLDSDDFLYEISVGEMNVELETEGGNIFGMSINARTGFDVSLDEATSLLRPLIDVRPAKMVVAVGCYEAPGSFDPGSVASLVRIGLPPLLRRASENLEFALPGLPLAKFTTLAGLAGQELGFVGLKATVVGVEKNQLLLEATPVLRAASTSGE